MSINTTKEHTMSDQPVPPVQDTTRTRLVKAFKLTPLELEWLGRIPSQGWGLSAKDPVDWMHDERSEGEKAAEWTAARLDDFSVVIAWEGEFGIDVGVVRARYVAGRNGYTEDTFEASPFPGGWSRVPLSKIVTVRASSTL